MHRIKKIVNLEFVKFLFTGAVNTLVGYIIYAVCYYISENVGFALAVDYTLGGLFNYYSYSAIAFRGYKKKRFLMFCFSYIITFFLNYAIVYLLIHYVKINAYFAQIVAISICSVVLYFFLKKLVFSHITEVVNNN